MEHRTPRKRSARPVDGLQASALEHYSTHETDAPDPTADPPLNYELELANFEAIPDDDPLPEEEDERPEEEEPLPANLDP